MRTKAGAWKWVQDIGLVVEYDSEGEPLRAIGTYFDIDRLMRALEELKRANATKDRFLSIIAHDLINPVGSLMQLSEILADNDALDRVVMQEVLESQRELSRGTFSLLENLLNWAKRSGQEIQFNPKVVDLSQIVDEIFKFVTHSAKLKDISLIKLDFESSKVYADEDMVRLIVRNLLSNAIKFTPKNGQIRVESNVNGKFLEICVIDNGVGMTNDEIDRIFSDHEYFSTYGTEQEKGTGLGLKLCKHFVRINGGVLSISSQPDNETRFSFTLPQYIA